MKHSGWYQLMPLILLIGMAHFLVDTMLGIWPIYKSMMNLHIAKAGLIVAGAAFIGEGFQLFFGTLSDKGHRKNLIILGLLVAMASSCFTYSSEYFPLFGLYVLTCIGSGCFHPCAASLMSSLIPARRGLLMAIFAAAGSLGLATSQLTFTTAYSFFDGHTSWMALPSIALAVVLVCYPFPQVNVQSANHRASLKDFAIFFKNPELRSLYIFQVANQSILWGMIFILPDALRTLGHADWICFGGGHFCFILGASCLIIPGGYLADIYSPRQVMLYGGLISIAAFYFILFFGSISSTVILGALFVLGATLFLMNPIAVSLGNQLEPTRSGAVSAFLMGLVWCISESLGPGGVGVMSAMFEEDAPVKALAILGLLFIIQIYATICLPKTYSPSRFLPQPFSIQGDRL